jgi:gamma-glutamyl phosphate reductase
MFRSHGNIPGWENRISGTVVSEKQNGRIRAICVLADLNQAIHHINRHSAKHSEAILTRDEENARPSLREVDSAAVFWNASTRFSD